MSRVLEWVELTNSGPPGETRPADGASSVWFRIVKDGEPRAWCDSEHTTGRPFVRSLGEWWGGEIREMIGETA